jgi:predicted transcriptional regulator
MEIICDVLQVIHEGSARPTQVMHRANLTWPVLMTYLEALLRHELLTREMSVSRTTYRLTAKGSAILNVYLKLKEEVGPLEHETISVRRLDELREPVLAPREKKATLSALRSTMEAANFAFEEGPVPGKSGTRYHFDLLAEGLNESLHGFDILTHVTESDVIRVFVKQLDSDISVQIVYTKSASEAAKKLAGSYSMELVPARDFKRFAHLITFRNAILPAKSVLLEVDPSEDYESVLQELVRDEVRRSHVSFFTWKGSPVYPGLPRGEKVDVYVMTTQRARPSSSRPREFNVPSHDEIALLESLERSWQRDGAEKSDLVIFDSVSELFVSLGDEKSQRFLKKAIGSLGSDGRRSLFIVKRGHHDDSIIQTLKGLFSERLVCDSSGLKLQPTP